MAGGRRIDDDAIPVKLATIRALELIPDFAQCHERLEAGKCSGQHLKQRVSGDAARQQRYLEYDFQILFDGWLQLQVHAAQIMLDFNRVVLWSVAGKQVIALG